MSKRRDPPPSGPAPRRVLRCAVYTRVSTDDGLEKDFMRPVYPIDRVDPKHWFDPDQTWKKVDVAKP